MNQLGSGASYVWDRFGAGKILGCVGVGCLLPSLCGVVMVIVFLWGFVPSLFSSESTVSPIKEENYIAYTERVQTKTIRPNIVKMPVVALTPTPIYDDSIPSMMYNQPYRGSIDHKPYVAYEPYQGFENSTLSKSMFLARVNFTGERRTPYSKGQRLYYQDGSVMTVVTGDFDFTLLRDATGGQWACPLLVDTLEQISQCYFWR